MEANTNSTVASGMFISRITSDDNKETSYDLEKVVDIQGLVVDSWELDGEYPGVSIRNLKNLWLLFISNGVSGQIGVIASNKPTRTQILISTNIFSFSTKISDYKKVVEADGNFFKNIGISMATSAGDEIPKEVGLIQFRQSKVEPTWKKLNRVKKKSN